VLFRPACVDVLLALLVLPVLGQLAALDGLVFFAGIAILRHRHDGRVQDLTASLSSVSSILAEVPRSAPVRHGVLASLHPRR
jgi:hypothetical protein